MKTLKGRRVLITGGAVRVGRAIALAVADAGADVALHYCNSEDAALAAAKEIEALGRSVALVRGDLANPDTAERVVSGAAEALGGLDAVVNNASLFARGAVVGTDAADWDRMMAVNARAPFLLGRALAAQLADDVDGDIVNINDIHALAPRGDYVPYTQSKALLHALTADMALALAPAVRVNEVALGAVLPPDTPPSGYQHTIRSELPLGRFPTVDDVAAAVVFLLGCSSVTGETIRIDGGQHLGATSRGR